MPLEFFSLRRLFFLRSTQIISQDTCRVFLGEHNFGVKSATDLSSDFKTLDWCTFSSAILKFYLSCDISFVLSCEKTGEFFVLEVNLLTDDEKKQWAVQQLIMKYNELGRTPKKSDYDGATCSRIKAFLGTWHRALETAGLREVKKKGFEK